MSNNFYDGRSYKDAPSAGLVVNAHYVCASCREFTRVFCIKIDPDLAWLMKVGQFPAVEVTADSNIKNMLGSRAHYLTKAMTSEAHGYGIGAYSYYRRIVEELIDELLAEIESLIIDSEKAIYSEALNKVKGTRVTSEKIDLVKDLLPPILRPDGMNPLSLLHGILSEGLHAESDERCLELAAEIRETLVFLSGQVIASKNSARAFTTSMRALLAKKGNAEKTTN
jgi:hypothetical protein